MAGTPPVLGNACAVSSCILGVGQDFSLQSIQGESDSHKGKSEKFEVSRRPDNPAFLLLASVSKCFICSLCI